MMLRNLVLSGATVCACLAPATADASAGTVHADTLVVTSGSFTSYPRYPWAAGPLAGGAGAYAMTLWCTNGGTDGLASPCNAAFAGILTWSFCGTGSMTITSGALNGFQLTGSVEWAGGVGALTGSAVDGSGHVSTVSGILQLTPDMSCAPGLIRGALTIAG
jgi:hypothetical protein